MGNVLITGANRGIGRAIATELARRDHRVVATARNPDSLDGLDAALKLSLDVTDPESVTAAVAAAEELDGGLDAVISNAGVIFYAAVEAIPLGELSKLFELNTIGALRLAQAVLPGMRARGRGRLLFMSSVAGRLVLSPGAGYSASKWALEALVECLAIEAGPLGIETALLEPGAVDSGALDDVTTYTLPGDDPYAARLTTSGGRDGKISTAQVAGEVVDAVEAEHLPLRIPIGEAAVAMLAARRAAPDDVPFDITAGS